MSFDTCLKFRSTLTGIGLCAILTTILVPGLQAQLPSVVSYGARAAYVNPSGSTASPAKVTRDAAGNIFYYQPTANVIAEIPVSGPIQVVVPATDPSMSPTAPASIAADPAGNLYISHNSVNIQMIPRLANGTYNLAGETSNSTFGTLTLNYFNGTDLAVDSLGNVFVAVGNSNAVPANGWTGKGILVNGPSTGSVPKYLLEPATAPTSITVDATGDVFYADGTSVYEITAASVASAIASGTALTSATVIGYYTGGPTCAGCTAIATPQKVFLDNNGNVYVSNGTSGYYVIVNNGSTFSTANPTYLLPGTVSGHAGYTYGAVDNQGNLFATFGGNVELYGASEILAGAQAGYAIGVSSGTTVPSGPSFGLLFTSTVTLNATAPFVISTNGSAYGGAGTAASSFNAASNTTCVAGTTYTAGQTCNLEVGYTPRQPGSFSASLNIYGGATSSATNLIASLTINGISTGPAITVDTGNKTTIGTGYTAPSGIAIDNTGAMYVADSTANAVYKYAAGSTVAGTAFGTGLSNPTATAIDGAGNLYIVDTGNNRVVYLPNNAGTFGTQTVLATGSYTLNAPRGIGVDAFGHLYIADTGNSRVLMLPNPFANAVGTPVLVGSGFSSPYGIAIDKLNNVFVADKGANVVYEVPGGYGLSSTATVNVGSGTQITVGSGLSAPTGVAVDGSGTVYVADGGNSRIVKIPNVAGVVATASQTVLFSKLAKPYGIATSSSADLYFTDVSSPAVYFAQRSAANAGTAATLPFGSVAANGTSTQTAVLSNAGYVTALTESVTTAPAAPFSLGTASSSDCASASPLAVGASCNLSLTFTSPATVGTSSTGGLTITDNTLNGTAQTTKASLTGYTSGPVATVTLTGSTTTVYGQAQTYTITAKDSAGSPSAAANGTYTVNITGTATSSASVTLTGGVGTFYLPSLGVGSYTLATSVSGVPASLGIAITKAPLSVIATSYSRIFDQANPAFGFTYSGFGNGDTAASLSGTAPVAVTTATRVSNAGSYPITLTGSTLTSANYTITLTNGTLTVGGAALQTILFPKLPNFSSGTTATLTGTATSGLPLTYTVTAGSATVSGNVLTITAAGTVTVQAAQAGNSNYAAAASVARSFTAQ